jgi:hypothetical protein
MPRRPKHRSATVTAPLPPEGETPVVVKIIDMLGSADLRDRGSWPELHAWLLRRLEELRSTFAKRVKTLALPMPG